MSRVAVLIASWLDQQQVDRIVAAEPTRAEVMYEPALLPTTRYIGDHHGPRRDLTDAQRALWETLLSRAEVSFDFDWDQPLQLLQRAPRLRWVQSSSSGVGTQVARLGLLGAPLIVTNAAGIHAQPLAEFALMGALHFAKEMPRLLQWKQERHWERYCGFELAGARMLIIGLGKVGARIAQLSDVFGVEVTAHRRGSGDVLPPGVRRMIPASEIDAELPRTDYLVLAAPATSETANLMSRERLEMLPRTAVVINVGRGSLIDEPTLTEMLRENRLRGAALDVFANEPLARDSELWSLPNVIISPHSASTVVQENDRLVDLFIENLHRYLDGHTLLNLFDHARQY